MATQKYQEAAKTAPVNSLEERILKGILAELLRYRIVDKDPRKFTYRIQCVPGNLWYLDAEISHSNNAGYSTHSLTICDGNIRIPVDSKYKTLPLDDPQNTVSKIADEFWKVLIRIISRKRLAEYLSNVKTL